MCAKSLKSCLTLCDHLNYSLPDSSIHGILQARILECISIPPPRDLPNPGVEPTSLMSPALAGGVFFFFFLPLVPSGKLQSEVASANIKVTASYPEDLAEIHNEGDYTFNQRFGV